MKLLTVSALVGAMMVLTEATAKSQLVKRSIKCSNDWFKINGRWFRFVPRAMTWAQAEKNCQSMGANLASIHSLKEYRQIQSLTGMETWIGGSDAQEENHWFWSDGTRFNYNNWCTGEPNNSRRKQHCLQMNYSAKKCWDDDVCWKKKTSLCARKG
ncbi:type-2 ice-structuring protein-like [Symphorus nematophorus]